MTDHKALRDAREELAQLLPLALEKALDAYLEFLARKTPTDVKEFKEYVAGLRSGASLTKYLLQLCDAVGFEKSGNDDVPALVANAEKEIAAKKKGHEIE